ncbi:phosphatidylserine decarboxylase family protein [Candidatus Woesearchaeota archaeon]|nr:phosphatidylserine decarboxylase family protein [Candidatus Woesearchaeota archaeon]
MAWVIYILSSIITIIILIFLFYHLWFLRKPHRNIPSKGIVSPADGKIIKILSIDGSSAIIKKHPVGKIKAFTKDVAKKCWVIVIVMTPLNVHFQRAPADARVLKVRYMEGRLLNAVLGSDQLEATVENEKNEILMQTEYGRMKVIQIAGLVAKRIVCFAGKNQNIKKGQEIGLIKFGSQVCLVVPRSRGLKLKVEEGEKVVDGETVIAVPARSRRPETE